MLRSIAACLTCAAHTTAARSSSIIENVSAKSQACRCPFATFPAVLSHVALRMRVAVLQNKTLTVGQTEQDTLPVEEVVVASQLPEAAQCPQPGLQEVPPPAPKVVPLHVHAFRFDENGKSRQALCDYRKPTHHGTGLIIAGFDVCWHRTCAGTRLTDALCCVVQYGALYCACLCLLFTSPTLLCHCVLQEWSCTPALITAARSYSPA